MTHGNSLLPGFGRLLGLVLPIGLGLFFIFTGLMKLSRPHELLVNVYAYELIGPPPIRIRGGGPLAAGPGIRR